MRLLDKVHEHLFRGREVGDHAVLHGPDRSDVRRGSAEHVLRVGAHRFDLPGVGVEGDDGRFVQDDAAAARKHAGVCRAEVDRHVGGKR